MKLQLLLANVMNRFMGEMINKESLENAGTPGWVTSMIQPIFNILDWLLPVIMILLGVAGVIYVIVLSVKYARAENADEKDQAKKRLINVAVGLIIMVIALIIVFVFIQYAPEIFGWVTEEAGISS